VFVLLGEGGLTVVARVFGQLKRVGARAVGLAAPGNGQHGLVLDGRLAIGVRGLHIGQLQAVQATHGAIAVQMTDGVEHLVIDDLLGIPNLIRGADLAFELEVEELGLVAGEVGLVAFKVFGLLGIALRGRTGNGQDGENGEGDGAKTNHAGFLKQAPYPR
jgi:hypothetical protein